MNKKIVVLGVSGSGKSLIGKELAEHLGCIFLDGDDFHSESNVNKMRQGIPLNDEDRYDWLMTLNQKLIATPCVVLACSALKPEYRTLLSHNIDSLTLLYLKGDIETIWRRLQERKGHYFSGRDMLESQFSTLIEPTQNEAHHIDISNPAEDVVQEALKAISRKGRP